MKIQAIEAIPLRVGFKQLFQFGVVDRQASQNVILKLITDDGLIGYGEACPVPAFTAETQHSIVETLEQRVAPLLNGRDPLDREPLLRLLERHLPHSPFTRTAVDIALWDLAGKVAGQPISVLLGGRYRDQVAMHGSVGWGAAATMVETALEQVALGYHTLKLYAGRGTLSEDLQRLTAVRAAVPADIRFLLDINGQWSVSDCRQALPILADLGVVLVEQPLPAWNRQGQAEVARTSPIDIAADEAVYSPPDVVTVGQQQLAQVINLGLSKLGGLLRSRECATVARALGLRVMVGSVLELGIASTAGLHLAASLPALAYPSYLVGPLKYEQDIVQPPITVTDGQMTVPTGPGLGLTIDEDALQALDARQG